MSIPSDTPLSIGIDLGTTNSVMSITPLIDDGKTALLAIPQLTQPGILEEKNQLPSFLYLPHRDEMSSDALQLPWSDTETLATGHIAKSLGAKTPLRLVASAKSWLCHGGVDRHQPFLPVNDLEDLNRVSPFDATLHYLKHLKAAFSHQYPEHDPDAQQITLTIPASFDPVARELTAEAAQQAGFRQLQLLEEPQAALYNWLRNHNDSWRDQVSVGETLLVVDIGGGTTDLSLVKVAEEDGNLVLERIAVGEHILLGGDNMDLALAYKVKAKMEQASKPLQLWQVQAITTACGEAKETLLGSEAVDAVPIRIPSRGSKLIGGALSSELTRQEVLETLVEGFFPEVTIDAMPVSHRRSGLAQQGLPYAQDPAITKHLAAFLTRLAEPADAGFDPLAPPSTDFIQPQAILFNGGVLKSDALRDRLLSVINSWLSAVNAPNVRELQGNDLDQGVALGASFSGFLSARGGLRIRAGLSHSYYVGIDSGLPAIPGMAAPTAALCIAPFGMEEGSETEPTPQEFTLRVGEPVSFRFFSATTRQEDAFGVLHEDLPEELTELPEISLTLDANSQEAEPVVTVKLKARITEIGILELLAEESKTETPRQWRIALETRQTAA